MAAALPVIAAVASFAGSIMSAQNQAENYNRQAQAEEYNAAVNRQAAANALASANANEEAKRRENAMKIGAQKAGLIESGLDITSGTGADLVKQSALNTELDALNIRYQGALQAKGYTDQAGLNLMNASASRANAKAATGPGMWLSAGANALGSYSSSKYLTK